MGEKHCPYWSHGTEGEVRGVSIFAQGLSGAANVYEKNLGGDAIGILKKNAMLGGIYTCELGKVPEGCLWPSGKLELYFRKNVMSDLWLAVRRGKA